MLINKVFKYRLNPTVEQENLFKQSGGNTRFLYNYLWTLQQEYYDEYKSYFTEFDVNYFLPLLKQADDFKFLNNTFSQALCNIGHNLRLAIDKAFSEQTAKERKKAIAKALEENDPVNRNKKLVKAYRLGFPKYKKKHDFEDSFCIQTRFKIKKSRIYIPNIGWVSYLKHRELEGTPKNITIKQEGKHWYASICCELSIPEKEYKSDNIVGVDLGLKSFAVLTDGTIIDNPKTLRKHERELKHHQKHLSRKTLKSKRYQKQQLKVRQLHFKIKDTRKDFLHQLTHRMITKYDGFALEDLSSKNMMKNHKLAKSIADASWSMFSNILQYKCLWNFKHFEKIDRFAPSSQICSNCGHRQDMPLSERTYNCLDCGVSIDRDFNASLNILDFSSFGRNDYRHGGTSIEVPVNCLKTLALTN